VDHDRLWSVAKNVISNIDKPKKVLGFDENGDILIERSKYSEVKSISNIKEWSEGFLLKPRHFQSVAPVV
jgi:hypothetical protein